MFAVQVNAFGGPEAFVGTEVDRPTVSDTAVLVELAVSGVNFLDVYQRNGATPLTAPFRAGVEGVGKVVEVGSQVGDLQLGQRVGWLTGGQGSFADFAVVDAARTVPIPDEIDNDSAASVLMQGVTAHYLVTDTYTVKPGNQILIHAAAGGVGLLLTQIAKLRGATVIGTVSTPAKADIAREAGADHVLQYDDFAAGVEAATNGRGVSVVYDGVGAATFEGSLNSLGVRGVYVVYGAASGPTPPIDVARLNSGGSLYVTRPSVVHYTRTQEELRARASDLFGWLAGGDLQPRIGARYPVSRVEDAFRALEGRQTTGKVLLTH